MYEYHLLDMVNHKSVADTARLLLHVCQQRWGSQAFGKISGKGHKKWQKDTFVEKLAVSLLD